MSGPSERLTKVKTKIVATVGPASRSPERLLQLLVAGVDVFRLNLAHGTRDEHAEVMQSIRAASRDVERPVAILADLQGPKIRLQDVPGEPLQCNEGELVTIARGPAARVRTAPPLQKGGLGGVRPAALRAESPTAEPAHPAITTTYPGLVDEVQAGDRILIGDGVMSLEVVERTTDAVVGRVVQPGPLRSRQGVAAPGVRLDLPGVTDADLADLQWAAQQEIDFLGVSFVRNEDDLRLVRERLAALGSAIQVVAKIERSEALEHLEAVVQEADAVMVARGDLGVEVDVAVVPVLQKRIIRVANRLRVPVITATQMLESMRTSSRPTRAEASDVANAILDGSDALMLSAETAIGDYPVESVATMSRIAQETERLLRTRPRVELPEPLRAGPPGARVVTEAVAHGAGRVAEFLEASLIVVATRDGDTALALSNSRNFVPTLGISDRPRTLRRMCLYWGVTPVAADDIHSSEELLDFAVKWGLKRDVLHRGDRVVVITSSHWSAEQRGGAGHDTILVHEVR